MAKDEHGSFAPPENPPSSHPGLEGSLAKRDEAASTNSEAESGRIRWRSGMGGDEVGDEVGKICWVPWKLIDQVDIGHNSLSIDIIDFDKGRYFFND